MIRYQQIVHKYRLVEANSLGVSNGFDTNISSVTHQYPLMIIFVSLCALAIGLGVRGIKYERLSCWKIENRAESNI